MSQLTEIRKALAARLAEVGEVAARPSPSEYAKGRGFDRLGFTVRVLVGPEADPAAEARLDDLLAPTGERSVKQLLGADPTLGGLVSHLAVVRSSGYQLYGQDRQLGAEWTIEVIAE